MNFDPSLSSGPGGLAAAAPTRRGFLGTGVALLSTGLLVPTARAAAPIVVDGLRFAGDIQLDGQTLQLNGVGLRAVAWLRGYAAGLYLTQRAKTPEQVLAATGPKRLQLGMLLEVGIEEFIKAFHKGVQRNTPAAALPALAGRMAQFDSLLQGIGKVKKMDIVDLDWLPKQGLRLMLNGRQRGPIIPGEDLYAALLRIFLGDRPTDKELKIGLLGGPVE